MSFWKSQLGEVTGNPDEAFAKSFRQIPDGTMALAKINSFVNQEYKENNFKYLQIEWLLTDGEFKGQKVQQKLKVFGGDHYDKEPEKTRHRALNMLKLIYKLFNVTPTHAEPPADQDLAIFIGKIAGIKIRETEPNEKGKQYNWVAEIHASTGFVCQTGLGLPIIPRKKTMNYSHDIDNALLSQDAFHNDDMPF